jgi:hypothetical protein
MSESTRLALLKQAECMRAHGVPDFPDPTFPKRGGVEHTLPPGLSPNSPAFQSAAKACGRGETAVRGGPG